jgi:dsRNA-specific ribonuclease
MAKQEELVKMLIFNGHYEEAMKLKGLDDISFLRLTKETDSLMLLAEEHKDELRERLKERVEAATILEGNMLPLIAVIDLADEYRAMIASAYGVDESDAATHLVESEFYSKILEVLNYERDESNTTQTPEQGGRIKVRKNCRRLH